MIKDDVKTNRDHIRAIIEKGITFLAESTSGDFDAPQGHTECGEDVAQGCTCGKCLETGYLSAGLMMVLRANTTGPKDAALTLLNLLRVISQHYGGIDIRVITPGGIQPQHESDPDLTAGQDWKPEDDEQEHP